MNLYLLSHTRKVEVDAVSSFIVGIYSSIDIVHKTIKEYQNIAGFKDYPNDFVVDKFKIKSTKELSKKQCVYLLQHEYTIGEYDYITKIGVFESFEKAEKIRAKLRKKPKYQNYPGGLYPPDGFCVDEYIINESGWREGFFSY